MRFLFSVLTAVAFFNTQAQTNLLDLVNEARKKDPQRARSILDSAAILSGPNTTAEAQITFLRGLLASDESEIELADSLLALGLKMSEQLGNDTLIAHCEHNIGVLREYQGDFVAAKKWYLQAYQKRLRIADSLAIASSLNNLGNTFLWLNELDSAHAYYLRASQYYEGLSHLPGMADANLNIGTVLDYQGFLEEAATYYQKSLKQYEQLSDQGGMAGAHNNLGLIYKNTQRYQQALEHYEPALKIYRALNHKFGVAVLLNNIGVVLELQGSYDQSLKYHQEALTINRAIDNRDGIANSLHSIGSCELQLGWYSAAIQHFQESLRIAEQIRTADRIYQAHRSLADTYERSGQPSKALWHLKRFQEVKDSVFTVEKTKAMLDLQTRYETELKEKQIALLETEKERNELAISQQQILIQRRNLGLVGLAVLLSLSLAIFWLILSRKSIRQKALLVQERLKQESKLRDAIHDQRLRISRDMHDEIGAGLTAVALTSDLALAAISRQNEADTTNKIVSMGKRTRELMDSLSEIVWTLNPAQDTLGRFVLFLQSFAENLFDSKARISVQWSKADENWSMPPYFRRHLLLLCKEALNNAAKYAAASEIVITFELQGGALTVEIRDNGVGFESPRLEGNGLKNMAQRCQELEGVFRYESQPAKGTRVMFEKLQPIEQITTFG